MKVPRDHFRTPPGDPGHTAGRSRREAAWARHRAGRVLLHALCLLSGSDARFHWRGIRRELFSGTAGRGGWLVRVKALWGRRRRRTTPTTSASSPFRRIQVEALTPVLLSIGSLWLSGAPLLETPAATGAALEPAPVSPVLVLRPLAQVSGAGIYLKEVIVVPPNPTIDLPSLRLAPAPTLGQTVSFTREQITAWLRQQAPALATTNWSGATQVRITRRTRTLNELELKDLLTQALQHEVVKDRGELELRFSRPWEPTPVPDDPLTLKVLDLPATGVNPSFIVRFELWTGEERVGGWQLAVQGKIWRDVPVARSLVRRGQLLRDADVTLERRDVLSLREPLSADSLTDDSLELVENVSPPQPILTRSVRVRPLIRRGALVEGVLREGALTISLKVEALEDGLPGQTVRVRNPKSRRELYGRVESDQTVLIAL
jgi:flagella basal body P-ring formation protein FlgA